jgi:chromosomal replication initiator protein
MAPVTPDAARIWREAAAVLSEQVSDAVWNSTFLDVRPREVLDGQLVLVVPSHLVRQRLEQRYTGLLQHALIDAGHPDLGVRVEVEVEAEAGADVGDRSDPRLIDLTTRTPAAEVPEPAHSSTISEDPAPTTPRRYTFDSFVIGPSNRFAHAAALSVAERPARSYNPLFVYGSAGLGKTHLLQAIAQYVRENYPGYQVRYISTEDLLNEFLIAIRNNTQPEFKRRFREIDVLLVDDIQFIEGKEQLQEEFFHTFNTLHDAQRQIVLSSDRHPNNIATLEDRLRSRFKMGLITDIQPPDFETRLAIVQKKAEQSGSHVPDDVLNFIAANISDNIRELEGALIRVTAYAALNDAELTVDLAADILADTITSTKPRQITPELILERTADLFGLEVSQLRSKSRTRDLVHARQVGMYVCRELTDLSYPQIGKEFGGRDHTTVIHAYEKVSTQLKERRKTYEDVTTLIQQIRATARVDAP